MATIAVIDYGMGNLRSVSKALEYASAGARVVVTFEPEQILQGSVIFQIPRSARPAQLIYLQNKQGGLAVPL